MPATRGSKAAVSKKELKPKTKKAVKVKSKKAADPQLSETSTEQTEETAYERIYRKWQEGKRKQSSMPKQDSAKQMKVAEASSSTGAAMALDDQIQPTAAAQFVEDENLMDMQVVDEQQRKEFPTQSEEEDMDESQQDSESDDEQNENLNANRIEGRASSAPRSPRTPCRNQEQLPNRSDADPGGNSPGSTKQTFVMMQNYMLKRGLISEPRSEEELAELIRVKEMDDGCSLPTGAELGGSEPTQRKKVLNTPKKKQSVTAPKKGRVSSNLSAKGGESEITIYKRAVEQIPQPGIEQQIKNFIQDVRGGNVTPIGQTKRISSSGDEMMDTSDESDLAALIQPTFIADTSDRAEAGTSNDHRFSSEPAKSQEELADEMIKENERRKAHLYSVPGKGISHSLVTSPVSDVSQIDQDYQMLDSHIDESVKVKIQSMEYIDFSKLICKSRVLTEEDNRMEIVSKIGMTFLSPVSDREMVQINGYNKWEQAFRVYSNVLTTKFPEKATELLQYGHTIHTASMAYIWENVYSYDREFRHHISRHPTRTWSVILQQAWTMLLKDRLKSDSGKGNFPQGKKKPEPCRRFNKGRCSFGLACRYEHRCSVPKCGKFGHGAHMCRLRNNSQDDKHSDRSSSSQSSK